MSSTTQEHEPRLPAGVPHVFFRMLGTFEIELDGRLVDLEVTGVGRRQIKLPMGLLLARCDTPVCKETLVEVARRRAERPPWHVITGLLRRLNEWGLGAALVVTNDSIMLRRHEVWTSDTERLKLLRRQAAGLLETGKPLEAMRVLGQAEPLCNGQLLPFYDVLPEYAIDDQVDYWQEFQKNLLLDLARMRSSLPVPPQCDLALRAAGRAVQIDRLNSATCREAAVIARQCGNDARARYYERLAGGGGYDRPPRTN